MKKLNIVIASLAVGLLVSTSCKKAIVYEPIGDGGQKIVKIVNYGGMKGTSGFAASALVLDLSLPTQSVTVQLELSAPQVSDKDLTVTVGYSAAKLAAFNTGQPAGSTIFQALTASQYSLSTTTVKIKAGQVLSEPFDIIFRPNQLDVAISYMLPIEIISITGGNGDIFAAAGTGTAYFRIIGNFLAGKYTWRYRRWQGQDTTVAPLQDLVSTTTLLPITATSLMTRELYTESFVDPGKGIVLGFTETGGVLSGFNVSLLPSTVAAIPAGGFRLIDGPKFRPPGFTLVGNAASKFIGTKFATYIQYENSTPAFRTLVNEFTKIP